jgi:hypothetical protein
MVQVTSTLLERARFVIRRTLERGEPAGHLIPMAHYARHLYASCDPNKVVGSKTVTECGKTFHVGLRR